MTNSSNTIVRERDLLRFTTAGSVDDGKSTLIGRMLFDSKQIFQDQLEQLEKSSRLRGEENVNLALLTDGLRAEREQGITIDVAYRYFSTANRKFIISDTPGHEQYTRNMVTGASSADLAIILIDARHGVLTQSRRHGIIASLLAIPHVVVCINKMDLVDYSKEIFDRIAADYRLFASKLNIHDITFIPVSALVGDNVVNRSEKTPWYQGPPLLQFLEDVTISADRNLVDFRFPVQYVVRPHQDFRGFSGRIASGNIRVGDEIIALPGMRRSTIKSITFYKDSLEQAEEGQSVILSLNDEIDISRGDMIVRRHNIPEVENEFEAVIAWMDDRGELRSGVNYIMRHTTQTTQAVVDDIIYRLDVNTLHRSEADSLKLNEIGRVKITSARPIFFDPYDRNRATGGFVIIDPNDFRTVGAGMIRHSSRSTINELRRESRLLNLSLPEPEDVLQWTPGMVALGDRVARQKHRAISIWLRGADSRTQAAISALVEKQLFDHGFQVVRLTEENTCKGLNADLRDNLPDHQESVRRHMHLSRLLTDFGLISICTYGKTDAELDTQVRARFAAGQFMSVALDRQMIPSDLTIDSTTTDETACAQILFEEIVKRTRVDS